MEQVLQCAVKMEGVAGGLVAEERAEGIGITYK